MKVLYSTHYWDGPLEGLCLYENKLHWFDCFAVGGWRAADSHDDDNDMEDWNIQCLPRIYRIYELSIYQRITQSLRRWFYETYIVKSDYLLYRWPTIKKYLPTIIDPKNTLKLKMVMLDYECDTTTYRRFPCK
jgi:hypothetical protein